MLVVTAVVVAGVVADVGFAGKDATDETGTTLLFGETSMLSALMIGGTL